MSSAPASKKMVSKEEVESDLLQDNDLHPLVNAQAAKDIFAVLLVFRFINALCVRTFFQPDEYFQSLEPAWQMAFGTQSGAWITWVSTSSPGLLYFSDDSQEWEHQLRSSLHPALFATIYYVLDKPMVFLSFFPQFRGMLFSVLPNIVQGIFAAIGDYYMYQFSERLYGIGSNNAWAVVCRSTN
jgi:phosphatidylinositol glycan class B